MNDLNDMLDHYLWTSKKLAVMLENMDEKQFSMKLGQDNRSIREIILHLVSIYAYFSSYQENKDLVDKSKNMNKTELLQIMKDLSKKTYDIFINNPNKMIPVKTKEGNMKEISGFSLFHMVTDHFAYHRGQIMTIYKGITGNEGIGTDYAVFLMEDHPDISL